MEPVTIPRPGCGRHAPHGSQDSTLLEWRRKCPKMRVRARHITRKGLGLLSAEAKPPRQLSPANGLATVSFQLRLPWITPKGTP